MGQYYRPIIEVNGKKNTYCTYVDNEYMFAKLTEHSWWSNPFVLAIASKLFRKKGKLAWVGDYADEGDINWDDTFKNVWKGKHSTKLMYNGFRLEGKYLINHTSKEIIDLDDWYKAVNEINKNDWIANPLPLLTAVGNGKGGGDFPENAVGSENIGVWAWDEIEITDENIYDIRWNDVGTVMEYFLKEKYKDYTIETQTYIFKEEF